MSTKKNVLFVCTGNSCRSPMAEMLFRRLVEGRDDYEVKSAGVSAAFGETISHQTAQILAERGISSKEFSSQPVTEELVRDATHIFAMTQSHREALERLYPEAAQKSYLLCEFCEIGGRIGCEVPDPMGFGMPAYQETCEMMEIALPSVLAYIDQTTKATSDP